MYIGFWFQSTAGPKTGCTVVAPEKVLFEVFVSIHSRPEDRLHREPRQRTGPAANCFNPQPARRPAAPRVVTTTGPRADGFNPQPARRPAAPLCFGKKLMSSSTFQSTAGPKTGCTPLDSVTHAGTTTFQSTAGPKTGCTEETVPDAVALLAVSIHSRPEDRLHLRFAWRVRGVSGVSIHSRPEDRLHRSPVAGRSRHRSRFNPQPARRPAAPVQRRHRVHPAAGFNPQPARRPAAPGDQRLQPHRSRVSIHSRPEDRLHRGRSSPGPRPRSRFNPQPARRPAAPCRTALRKLRNSGFNPQPARRPAAPPASTRYCGRHNVSIHSRPEDRLHPASAVGGTAATGTFQSTAGPKTGCTPAKLGPVKAGPVFQSTAGPKTGCTRKGARVHPRRRLFQSTAGPKTGCTSPGQRSPPGP